MPQEENSCFYQSMFSDSNSACPIPCTAGPEIPCIFLQGIKIAQVYWKQWKQGKRRVLFPPKTLRGIRGKLLEHVKNKVENVKDMKGTVSSDLPMHYYSSIIIIPNTAVFGPTKLIGTIPSTMRMRMRMKILDEDFGWRFHWSNRKIGVTKKVTELPNVDRFENEKRI